MQIRAEGRRILHEGERDCPIRRCCQALVGEAPPPGLPRAIRDGLRRSVVDFARATGYRSLGRVAFLVAVERGAWSFLEMNARIEVEHPVTEAITGLDLIALQIAIAEGRPLAIAQDAIATMRDAPRAVSLTGVPTNAELHRAIMADAAFARGGVDTAWLAGLLPRLQGDARG